MLTSQFVLEKENSGSMGEMRKSVADSFENICETCFIETPSCFLFVN